MADSEDVRKALQEIIKGQDFANKIKEVWSRKGSADVRLPFAVYRSQKTQHDGYPCCEIDITVGRSTDNRNNLRHLQYEVHIFWHDRHHDEEELDDFISRYLVATAEYFFEHPFLGEMTIGNPEPIIQDEQYSPFVPENVYEGRPLLKSGLLIILFEVLNDGRY